MKLVVRLYSPVASVDRSLGKHFLMAKENRELTAVLVGGANQGKSLQILQPDNTHYEVVLPESDSVLLLTFQIRLPRWPGQSQGFLCFHVSQWLDWKPGNAGAPPRLQALKWIMSDVDAVAQTGKQPTSDIRASLHPTMQLSDRELRIDCTMLDITPHWKMTRSVNPNYTQMLNSIEGSVGFRVLASLVNAPMIWFVVHPKTWANREVKSVIPHVFFAPADHAEMQPYGDNKKYFEDKEYAERKKSYPLVLVDGDPPVDTFDGWRLKLYLMSPTPEDTKLPADTTDGRALSPPERVRNVNLLDGTAKSPDAEIWNVPAGLGKAVAEGSARQLLIYPQRVYGSKGNGRAVTEELPKLYSSAIRLLESCTSVFGLKARKLARIEKAILSCFSDSGRSMLVAGKNKEIKANLSSIICVEPMPKSKSVAHDFARLFEQLKGINIYYIGRWRTGQFGLSKETQAKVTQLLPSPQNYDAIFNLPPVYSSANPFIQFRIRRFIAPDEDPSLRAFSGSTPQKILGTAERHELDGIRSRLSNPNDANALLARIFARHKADPRGSYGHSISMTAGQVFTSLPPPFYGKKQIYKTFFHEALELADRKIP